MSLGKHTLLNLGGAIIPMMIALLTVPLYLQYIGAERYGVLAVIMALLGYFGFFDFGFGRAIAQRMASLTSANDVERSNLLWTALTITFLLGIVGSLFLWLFADYILTHLIEMSESNRKEAASAVGWLLLALPILFPASVLQGALQARLRFVELNFVQVVGSTTGQLLPLGVAVSGNTELNALVPAVLASRLLTMSLLYAQCRKHVPIIGRPVIDRTHLKPMMAYGGWISVMTFLAPLLVTIDRLIIATIGGAKAVAYYTVPYDLVARMMVIPGSLSSALFPRLAAADEHQGRDMANRATNILIAFMTPVVIAALFLIQPFLELWVGADFSLASQGVAEIILIGVWVNAVVIPHHSRFLATSSPKKVVGIFLFEIPVYIGMLWIGLTNWGIVGAAAAWSLRVLLDTVLLLKLNKVFLYTLRANYISMLLVIVASLVVLWGSLSFELHWAVAGMLICASTLKDKQILSASYNHLITKSKGAS